jgi:hypothetical protein
VHIESIDIQVSAEFSDDKTLRFSLTKTWNSDKPKALFILLNPSKADVVRMDNTFCNIVNQSIDLDFGSVTLVNLFPLMATDSKKLTGKLELGKEENLKIISREIISINDIFIAWGTDNNKYRQRKLEIELILKKHGAKNVRCWFDKNKSHPKHLRIVGKDWLVKEYKYSFFREA